MSAFSSSSLQSSRAPVRRAARALALLALAGQLAACAMFSSSKAPKPRELEPNEARFAASQVWMAQIGNLGNIELQPLVHQLSVTLATASGTVVSLQPTTGEQLWQARVGERLVAGVGGDGQTFAVISARNEVVALRDGQVLWRHALPGRSFTPPLVAGGRVFVITAERALLALDADNGALIWDRPAGDEESLALQQALLLTAVGDTLVAGFSGRVVGIDPDTGTLRWEASVAVPRGINDIERLVDVVGHFSREDSSLCVQAFQAAIGCVDARSGSTSWSQRLNGAVGVHGDGQTVYSVDATGRIQAWGRQDGHQLWLSDRLQYRQPTAPLRLGRVLAVGDASGWLHLLEGSDGSPLNRFQTNRSGLRIAPVYAGNTLIAISNNGTVYGFRPD
ncbi:outer membrane protein assembly factor BamB [Vandammella animalimorsus]|uniref:Outer membrane protein assembly factor BamB n=1 Tax=Vandammella animalimorsus TaxID=2029117 RepID=A0A2A2APG5_9BURK|nr:outer membrane protein assembly factor BamB [Vandammella animalimorsus]PAT39653.1 outer membrane protein assembly factor BamB [Vandammella animalimorsus]